MSLADDLKKQTNDFRTKKIDYQVDTIGTDNNKGGAGGYYTSATNTITMNYHEADKWLLNWEKTLMMLFSIMNKSIAVMLIKGLSLKTLEFPRNNIINYAWLMKSPPIWQDWFI